MHTPNAQVSRQATERSILKVALTSMAATSIEWYDFLIYATAAALVFPALFFPVQTPLVGSLLAFATFGVAFVARPIGAAVFGHFGDSVGRRKALVFALVLMGVATTLIGLLPGYSAVGFWAPLLLTLLRFLQGIAVGGQWGGAVLLAVESAPADRRGFYSSFAQVGVPVALVLANLLFLLISATVTPEAFQAWGWRIPFLISGALVGFVIYLQLRLEDTSAFRHLQELKRQRDDELVERVAAERDESAEEARAEIEAERRGSPVLEALRTYPKQIALAGGAFIALGTNFYIFVSFIITYGTTVVEMSQSLVLAAVLVSIATQMAGYVIFGALSDRYGRRGLFMLGAALMAIFSFVFWPMVNTGSFVLVALALSLGHTFLGMGNGGLGAFYSELFPTRIRYSGASLGYQLGQILGGAIAPLVATALLASFGSWVPIAVYMAATCLVTLVSVYLLTETRWATIDEAQGDHQIAKASAQT